MMLSDEVQTKLRNDGIIKNEEIVIKNGDIYMAENVLTGERRLVNINPSILTEKVSNKRVLFG